MRIILIGNFLPDKQESMERFAQMLNAEFKKKGYSVDLWRPKPLFSYGAKSTIMGMGKWLGYIDKWLLFPIVLRFKLLTDKATTATTRFHICDHSNSPYLQHLPLNLTSITCHDVLAIRGGLGFSDAYVPASKMGRILQKWILNNLLKAKRLATVSKFTYEQLLELADQPIAADKYWTVIYNSFNGKFNLQQKKESVSILSAVDVDTDMPYILHVGSSLTRKNRKLLLDMVADLGDRWKGRICFAGEALEDTLLEHATRLGLSKRIYSVVRPSHRTLVALYNLCHAFIFPSFSEGFGWPVIEAQACGAPVIASNLAPMPEISGGAAIHADPLEPKQFAEALLLLQNPAIRNELVIKGNENIKRFETNQIIAAYLKLLNLSSS
jgi:glycosyltransferase involved in cell wall biosynthesis